MSIVMFLVPLIGLPERSPANMLAGMTGTPVVVGWIMHFMIGIFFAAVYVYLFAPNVKIGNIYLKGAIYGFLVFIFAQVMMMIMASMMPMPPSKDSMALVIAGSILSHVIFGIVVAKVAGE
jgi:uncharacterized membrane protein YagU involved in acid resistance